MEIKKILIANRGEIAVRVMRTCREMGIKTVAVYSEADAQALHVQMADEAYLIGPAPAFESYLNSKKILEVAKKSGADAIHPGYGFLSENAAFSQSCKDSKIIFIGPRPQAIMAMGDKVSARQYAQKIKVPIVPGTIKPVSDISEMKKLAKEFGYPVLIKAAGGGGGKGMRVVYKEKDLAENFQRAVSEASASFHDARVYLEKYIEKPRHVEVQIVCDQKGQGVSLFNRECSMQRRHQKIIEEAPCPYLKESIRKKMAAAALKLAKAINYTGVGTLEFLVDQKQGFYFLEMNTRLQVEHTVTEMITGLDLVRLQIEVASGKKLTISQKDVERRGHAIECRIYAEDPENGFRPSPGKIEWVKVPEGPGVRNDSGIFAGTTVSIYYDPMMAKLIVQANNREQAIAKMLLALSEYQILGPVTNIDYLKTLLETKEFKQMKMHTQLIDDHPEWTKSSGKKSSWDIALAVAAFDMMTSKSEAVIVPKNETSSWWNLGLEESLRE